MDNLEITSRLVEVTEAGKSRANRLLEAGWLLLDIQWKSTIVKRPQEEQGSPQSHYIRRGVIYILGRPRDVAPGEQHLLADRPEPVEEQQVDA